MPKLLDLTGKRFGHLVVIERANNRVSPCGRSSVYWKCVCDCGRDTVIRASNLTMGHSKKCNVCKNGKSDGIKKFHGERGTRLYRMWRNMKSRCLNPNASEYNIYGGRGINICKEWIDDFASFRDWALINGYTDELSIDRIDCDGGYNPLNCRFVTFEEQQKNKRSLLKIEYRGETKTLKEWTKELNIPYCRTQMRLKNGWSVKDAFNVSKNGKCTERRCACDEI